jgi:hypothetical protein
MAGKLIGTLVELSVGHPPATACEGKGRGETLRLGRHQVVEAEIRDGFYCRVVPFEHKLVTLGHGERG